MAILTKGQVCQSPFFIWRSKMFKKNLQFWSQINRLLLVGYVFAYFRHLKSVDRKLAAMGWPSTKDQRLYKVSYAIYSGSGWREFGVIKSLSRFSTNTNFHMIFFPYHPNFTRQIWNWKFRPPLTKGDTFFIGIVSEIHTFFSCFFSWLTYFTCNLTPSLGSSGGK